MDHFLFLGDENVKLREDFNIMKAQIASLEGIVNASQVPSTPAVNAPAPAQPEDKKKDDAVIDVEKDAEENARQCASLAAMAGGGAVRQSPQFSSLAKHYEECKCAVCGLQFNSRVNLEKHRMSHWQRVESTKRKKDAEKKKDAANDSEEKMDADEKKDSEEKNVAQKEASQDPVPMVISPSQTMDTSPPPSGGSGGGESNVQSVSPGVASNMQTFNTASKRSYNCRECPFVGNGPKGLLNHIKVTNHKDTDSLVERCYTCGFICNDFGQLMSHRKSVHFQSINSCRYEKEGKCKWGPEKCWFKHESASVLNVNVSNANVSNENQDFQMGQQMVPPDLVQNMAQEVATMFQQAIARVLQYSGEGERRSQGV